MDKKLLAAIATNPLYKIRRLQAICYLSLFINVLAIVCLLIILGR
jgi:hypothetical protein